ncbi:hypothetical protein VCV18_010782 [Metarhizium anisopliae]
MDEYVGLGVKQGKQSPRVSCPIEHDTDHEPAEQCVLLRCLPRHGMRVWNKSWIGGGPEGGAFLDAFVRKFQRKPVRQTLRSDPGPDT